MKSKAAKFAGAMRSFVIVPLGLALAAASGGKPASGAATPVSTQSTTISTVSTPSTRRPSQPDRREEAVVGEEGNGNGNPSPDGLIQRGRDARGGDARGRGRAGRHSGTATPQQAQPQTPQARGRPQAPGAGGGQPNQGRGRPQTQHGPIATNWMAPGPAAASSASASKAGANRAWGQQQQAGPARRVAAPGAVQTPPSGSKGGSPKWKGSPQPQLSPTGSGKGSPPWKGGKAAGSGANSPSGSGGAVHQPAPPQPPPPTRRGWRTAEEVAQEREDHHLVSLVQGMSLKDYIHTHTRPTQTAEQTPTPHQRQKTELMLTGLGDRDDDRKIDPDFGESPERGVGAIHPGVSQGTMSTRSTVTPSSLFGANSLESSSASLQPPGVGGGGPTTAFVGTASSSSRQQQTPLSNGNGTPYSPGTTTSFATTYSNASPAAAIGFIPIGRVPIADGSGNAQGSVPLFELSPGVLSPAGAGVGTTSVLPLAAAPWVGSGGMVPISPASLQATPVPLGDFMHHQQQQQNGQPQFFSLSPSVAAGGGTNAGFSCQTPGTLLEVVSPGAQQQEQYSPNHQYSPHQQYSPQHSVAGSHQSVLDGYSYSPGSMQAAAAAAAAPYSPAALSPPGSQLYSGANSEADHSQLHLLPGALQNGALHSSSSHSGQHSSSDTPCDPHGVRVCHSSDLGIGGTPAVTYNGALADLRGQKADVQKGREQLDREREEMEERERLLRKQLEEITHKKDKMEQQELDAETAESRVDAKIKMLSTGKNPGVSGAITTGREAGHSHSHSRRGRSHSRPRKEEEEGEEDAASMRSGRREQGSRSQQAGAGNVPQQPTVQRSQTTAGDHWARGSAASSAAAEPHAEAGPNSSSFAPQTPEQEHLLDDERQPREDRDDDPNISEIGGSSTSDDEENERESSSSSGDEDEGPYNLYFTYLDEVTAKVKKKERQKRPATTGPVSTRGAGVCPQGVYGFRVKFDHVDSVIYVAVQVGADQTGGMHADYPNVEVPFQAWLEQVTDAGVEEVVKRQAGLTGRANSELEFTFRWPQEFSDSSISIGNLRCAYPPHSAPEKAEAFVLSSESGRAGRVLSEPILVADIVVQEASGKRRELDNSALREVDRQNPSAARRKRSMSREVKYRFRSVPANRHRGQDGDDHTAPSVQQRRPDRARSREPPPQANNKVEVEPRESEKQSRSSAAGAEQRPSSTQSRRAGGGKQVTKSRDVKEKEKGQKAAAAETGPEAKASAEGGGARDPVPVLTPSAHRTPVRPSEPQAERSAEPGFPAPTDSVAVRVHLPTGVRNIPQGHQHPPEATETFTFSVEEARKKTVKEFREMLQQRLAQDSSQRIHNAAAKRANAREALGQDEDHELLSELSRDDFREKEVERLRGFFRSDRLHLLAEKPDPKNPQNPQSVIRYEIKNKDYKRGLTGASSSRKKEKLTLADFMVCSKPEAAPPKSSAANESSAPKSGSKAKPKGKAKAKAGAALASYHDALAHTLALTTTATPTSAEDLQRRNLPVCTVTFFVDWGRFRNKLREDFRDVPQERKTQLKKRREQLAGGDALKTGRSAFQGYRCLKNAFDALAANRLDALLSDKLPPKLRAKLQGGKQGGGQSEETALVERTLALRHQRAMEASAASALKYRGPSFEFEPRHEQISYLPRRLTTQNQEDSEGAGEVDEPEAALTPEEMVTTIVPAGFGHRRLNNAPVVQSFGGIQTPGSNSRDAGSFVRWSAMKASLADLLLKKTWVSGGASRAGEEQEDGGGGLLSSSAGRNIARPIPKTEWRAVAEELCFFDLKPTRTGATNVDGPGALKVRDTEPLKEDDDPELVWRLLELQQQLASETEAPEDPPVLTFTGGNLFEEAENALKVTPVVELPQETTSHRGSGYSAPETLVLGGSRLYFPPPDVEGAPYSGEEAALRRADDPMAVDEPTAGAMAVEPEHEPAADDLAGKMKRRRRSRSRKKGSASDQTAAGSGGGAAADSATLEVTTSSEPRDRALYRELQDLWRDFGVPDVLPPDAERFRQLQTKQDVETWMNLLRPTYEAVKDAAHQMKHQEELKSQRQELKAQAEALKYILKHAKNLQKMLPGDLLGGDMSGGGGARQRSESRSAPGARQRSQSAAGGGRGQSRRRRARSRSRAPEDDDPDQKARDAADEDAMNAGIAQNQLAAENRGLFARLGGWLGRGARESAAAAAPRDGQDA